MKKDVDLLVGLGAGCEWVRRDEERIDKGKKKGNRDGEGVEGKRKKKKKKKKNGGRGLNMWGLKGEKRREKWGKGSEHWWSEEEKKRKKMKWGDGVWMGEREKVGYVCGGGKRKNKEYTIGLYRLAKLHV